MNASSNRPRLAHVTTIPDTLMFLTGQIGHMQAKGFEVHAVSSPGELPSVLTQSERIIHHSVEMTRQITPMQDAAALRKMVGQLKSIRPSIVHSHTPKAGLLGMVSAYIARVPVRIYHIHGLPFTTATGRKRQLLGYTERIACKLAHQVLCVSDSIRDVAVSEGFCAADKIRVLRKGSINGVDAEQRFNPRVFAHDTRAEVRRKYGIPTDAIVVGFVGRIVRDKGINELTQAWQRLRNQHPGAHLMLVGDLEKEDPVPASTEQMLREDDRVHMTGVVWDVPPLYTAMDMIVLPTYREGFPVVPLEAAAMELPIVATTVPGCVDAVVDGVTGTLVPPRDPNSLGKAIGLYLREPNMRSMHGKSARKRALTEFRPVDIWEATYSEYRRLLDRNGVTGNGLL